MKMIKIKMVIKYLNLKSEALALIELKNANKTNEDSPNKLNEILSGMW